MQTLNTDVIVASIITTLLIIIILLVVQRKLDLNWKIFYLTLVAGLPLSYFINQIKIPILNFLFATKVTNNSLNLIDAMLWVFIVGFTEELIKFILFILIIQVLKYYTLKNYRNTVVVAYCTGIGFGIGEIWYLASTLLYYSAPGATLISWLSGFGLERFFVTFGHAMMFMVIIYGYRRNTFLTGVFLFGAMLLHAFYDFPISLTTIGVISTIEMSLIVFLEIIVGFVISFILLNLLLRYPEDNKRIEQKKDLLRRAKESML